ncbi:MAG: IS110 family transposase [Actinobacteria bacterium]|nr:IS110 family transposase [Actinomycetota bacterium]
MTQVTHNTQSLSIVNPNCCGVDVHKSFLIATIIKTGNNNFIDIISERFETFTDDIFKFRDWLIQHNCPVVAIESTGIYWCPVFNILEDHINVILVNARHYKNVPGRKTDFSDSRWLAELLRFGMLKPSFIVPKEFRDIRDLIQTRQSYVNSAADYKKRIQKLFKKANINLDSVLSDMFGVSGRNILSRLANGQFYFSKTEILSCLKARTRNNANEVIRALNGFFQVHHQFILVELLNTLNQLETTIKTLEERIEQLMKPYKKLTERLINHPGLGYSTVYAILSLIGIDMSVFHSPEAIASWAKLSSGHNESAGKRKSTRTGGYNVQIKTVLVEAAWAAVKTKGSYFKAKYHKLKARIGPKKAIIAIARKILINIYFMIKDGTEYIEKGEEYLILLNRKRIIADIKKKAEILGITLTIPDHLQ